MEGGQLSLRTQIKIMRMVREENPIVSVDPSCLWVFAVSDMRTEFHNQLCPEACRRQRMELTGVIRQTPAQRDQTRGLADRCGDDRKILSHLKLSVCCRLRTTRRRPFIKGTSKGKDVRGGLAKVVETNKRVTITGW